MNPWCSFPYSWGIRRPKEGVSYREFLLLFDSDSIYEKVEEIRVILQS
jgi:hypothetical protein